METFLALCLGLSLSAACGFRVFIPPLVMSVAALYGDLTLPEDWAWIGSEPALVVFAIATAAEVGAYYIPVLDNLLDTLEAPVSLVAGTLVTASVLGDTDPILQWTVGAIAGGGAAGLVEGMTAITRLASTGLTGGLGNPAVSTMEGLSALVLSILALSVPLLAIFLVLALLVLACKQILNFVRKRRERLESPTESCQHDDIPSHRF